MLAFDNYQISPIAVADAWSLCDFMVSNEDRFKHYLPQTLAENLTPTLSQRFVEKKVKQYNLRQEFLFTIKENNSNTLVGLVYVKELDWLENQAEFAYCIGYPFEGKGVISTAVKRLTAYAFNSIGLLTLQIIVHKSNIGSIKVAENNNFVWQETLLNEFTPPNQQPLHMELYELYKA